MRKGIHVFLTPFHVKAGRRMHFGFLRRKGKRWRGGLVGNVFLFVLVSFLVFCVIVQNTDVRSVR